MEKATRRDVAKLAGVSTATVSNVMNDSSKVKDETVARVMEAMVQLNYRPNMVARSLSTKKTMQIGIFLENISNPYYGEIVEHFEAAANEKGYFVNICTGAKRLDDYLNNLVTRSLDGAFVAMIPYQYDMSKLYDMLDNDFKLVISGNTSVDLRRISSIENDYATAMPKAIDYLADLHHEDIAYLSALGNSMNYDGRCRAYLEHMKKRGFSCKDTLLVDGKEPYEPDVRMGYEQAIRLMESGRRFTAVICGNDVMAIGAIHAFTEKGLRVPQDVSVMGFDGIALGRYLTPTLTTMAVEAKNFGRHAFGLLYGSMTQNTVGFYSNKLKLIEGYSTTVRK